MSPRKRPNQKRKQPKAINHEEDPAFTQDENIPDIHAAPKAQTVQISSAQAQLYFEYLRKKISHQTNDPFSLPFLNLKFQQLDSWKGATQQLNLDSKIYGMRVDNCHDNAIKMLNYVIRNQQNQIGKDTGAAQKQVKKQDAVEGNQLHKSNHNFYLEKAQKINGGIEKTSQLDNVSFWRTVFKKSQTLAQIQMNTVQISLNLTLEVDLKKVSYIQQKCDSSSLENFDSQFLQNYPEITQSLKIFKEIELVKKEVNEEIQEILTKNTKQKYQKDQLQIQNPLWQTNLGIRGLDFSDFYQEFNQFQNQHEESKHSSQNTIFSPEFQNQPIQSIFLPNVRELRSIQIDPLQENLYDYEEANDEQHFETDLYQPQKDILFNLSNKKAKKIEARNHGKIRRTYQTKIDFNDEPVLIDRKKAFNIKNSGKTKFKNNNLVPISYVVVYESRNPFRKLKKVPKNYIKTNIYDSYPLLNCFQTQQISKPLDCTQTNMISQMHPQFDENSGNKQCEDFEGTHQASNYVKNVPIKTVKQQILREIKNSERNMFSKSLHHNEESYNLDQTSYMDTYLQEEACMIGLKFLKQKMKTYDPLDLLVSMLHVAFEQQVILQPVYSLKNETGNQDDVILEDILIQADHLH